ncbi:MAG: hypothetical protein IJI49_03985 [Bacilli bacterium]|nr:hypothetical protein [Bacilli bacterium]
MNNNLNVITELSRNYNLTRMQYNELITKYQNDSRDTSQIKNEVTNICEYYQFQNRLLISINNTNPLPEGKNYYVTTFDKNSNFYLQPVSITITNPEKEEVLVENSFKGYQKHTNVDDIEIAICQFGKALGFDLVEEYRLYNSNRQKDSIIIKDLVNDDEFYDVDNLKKRFNKLINAGRINKEPWVDISNNLKIANTKEDYITAINYGLNILKSLPSMLEEDYNKLEQKYFEMLIFDSLINQSERNFKDYGIICDKETKRYSFAPLFDNVFPTILKNNDVFSFNDITCNRYELTETLIFNYYDKVEKKLTFIINNEEKILKIASTIFKYHLDINTYNMLLNNIKTNIENYKRLLTTKEIQERNQSNAGFVNIAQLLLALIIILVFSFCIAYLLFNIK